MSSKLRKAQREALLATLPLAIELARNEYAEALGALTGLPPYASPTTRRAAWENALEARWKLSQLERRQVEDVE